MDDFFTCEVDPGSSSENGCMEPKYDLRFGAPRTIILKNNVSQDPYVEDHPN